MRGVWCQSQDVEVVDGILRFQGNADFLSDSRCSYVSDLHIERLGTQLGSPSWLPVQSNPWTQIDLLDPTNPVLLMHHTAHVTVESYIYHIYTNTFVDI